jgi:hypothetical protein
MRAQSQKAQGRIPKFYLYKMTVDDGGAPCVQDGMLTLAICKPTIRRVAPVGSVVLAFAGECMKRDGYLDNCIVYAAVVSRRVPNREYYSKRQHAHRRDCIYKRSGNGFARKAKAKFHHGPGDLEHDLGAAPDYPNAVLLSNGAKNFRYFGTKCPVEYKKKFPRLRRLIERLTEGHRVNHDPVLYRELLGLKRELWKVRSAITRLSVIAEPGSRCGCDDVAVECALWPFPTCPPDNLGRSGQFASFRRHPTNSGRRDRITCHVQGIH